MIEGKKVNIWEHQNVVDDIVDLIRKNEDPNERNALRRGETLYTNDFGDGLRGLKKFYYNPDIEGNNNSVLVISIKRDKEKGIVNILSRSVGDKDMEEKKIQEFILPSKMFPNFVKELGMFLDKERES